MHSQAYALVYCMNVLNNEYVVASFLNTVAQRLSERCRAGTTQKDLSNPCLGDIGPPVIFRIRYIYFMEFGPLKP